MQSIKDIAENLDLYGVEVLTQALKDNFSHVSFTANGKTIPTEGSRCIATKSIKSMPIISRFIYHRNGRITAVTKSGTHLQFLNI